MLAPIAQALGDSVEDLLRGAGTQRATVPGNRARRMFEQVQRVARRQQDKICELLGPYLAKNVTTEKDSSAARQRSRRRRKCGDCATRISCDLRSA